MFQVPDISSYMNAGLNALMPGRNSGTLGNNGIFNVNAPRPYGGAYRGLGSSIINPEDIAKENFYRDLQKTLYAAELNEIMAQNNRDFQERMTRNAYQYVIEDMKKAGINPILAFSQGGASVPHGATGSTSSVSGTSSSSDPLVNLLSVALSFIAGMIPKTSFSFVKKI